MALKQRTFQINVLTDNEDGYAIIESAATKIACELDWGNDSETVIETVEIGNWGDPQFISLYHLEPE